MAFHAKRRFQRSVQRDAVKIFSPSGLEYATYEDLSRGGLKLWMDHDFAPETTLSLEFSIRNNLGRVSEVKLLGRVVRCIKSGSGFEVGVEFFGLSENHRSLMANLFDGTEGPF